MPAKFTLTEKIVFVFLLFNTYALSIFPFSDKVSDFIFIIQFFLLSVFFLIEFKFDRLLAFRFSLSKLNNKLLFILFVVFVFSTLIVNSNNYDLPSIIKLSAIVFVFYLFFIYLAGIFYNDGAKMEKFLNAIIIFAVLNSLFGFLNIFTGLIENKITPGYLIGFFFHPNSAGFVYSISIPILFYKYFAKKINAYAFIIVAALLFVALLYTFSRSAYFAVALSILILTYFKSKKSFVITIVISVMLFLFVIGNFLATKGGLSSFSRLLLYYTAYDMITSGVGTFMWGYGILNSLKIFSVERLFFGSFENVVDPHNFILLMGIQFGMVLTFVFLFFVGSLLVLSQVYKKYLPDGKNKLVELSFAIILGLIIQDMFEDIMIYPEFFLFPIFLIFLGYMYYSLDMKNSL